MSNNGPIVDQTGRQIGEHDGAIFYTIGQRHGLDVGGGLPYYVTSKDMSKNIVYVTNDISDEQLWSDEIRLGQLHWINDRPKSSQLQVRTRHRAKLISCELVGEND